MRFVKMQGIGNDFILCHGKSDAEIEAMLGEVQHICDRRKGIGADGIIFALPPRSASADFRMRILNSDGSEAEMCGNGIRCLHRYCQDENLTAKASLAIETGAGIVRTSRDGARIRVEMGPPVLDASKIPTTQSSGRVLNQPLAVDGDTFHITAVSMGNPHAVIFIEKLTDALVLGIGKKIECHPFFPRRVNVEFVKIISNSAIVMRVYERGCGETQACGTGACAAVVAGILNGILAHKVNATLPGGELSIEWDGVETHPVFLTGPAEKVFEGVIGSI
jgi:diaminopimelate epimerase